MLWSDVYSLRKDPSHTEIGNNELCVWLELKMNKPAITTETSAVETPQESAPAQSAAKSEAATSSAATADDSVSADVKKVKAVLSTTIKSEKRLAGIMKMIDVDNSQSLNKEEVREAFQYLGSTMDAEKFEKTYTSCDKNKDGLISYKEFKKTL